MAKEPTIKENIATITANIGNLADDVSEIKRDIKTQNSNVVEVTKASAVTRVIADNADKKATDACRLVNRLIIGVVGACITAIGAVVVVIIV